MTHDRIEEPERAAGHRVVAEGVYIASCILMAFFVTVIIAMLIGWRPAEWSDLAIACVAWGLISYVMYVQANTDKIVVVPPVLGLVYSCISWVSARNASWIASVCLSIASLLIPMAVFWYYPEGLKLSILFSAVVILPFAGLYRHDGT